MRKKGTSLQRLFKYAQYGKLAKVLTGAAADPWRTIKGVERSQNLIESTLKVGSLCEVYVKFHRTLDGKRGFFKTSQVCIPLGCVPPACCPYLPACTAPGCETELLTHASENITLPQLRCRH